MYSFSFIIVCNPFLNISPALLGYSLDGSIVLSLRSHLFFIVE